ncbi:MAG: DUF932 domain-containing protein [Actinomycetes bacterium]
MKIRHSRLSGLRIDEARHALSVVEETAEEFAETLRHLSSTTVTDRQWFEFSDAWYPVPGESGRARTIATRVREELVEISPRCAGEPLAGDGVRRWCRR